LNGIKRRKKKKRRMPWRKKKTLDLTIGEIER